jgi:transposase
MKEGVIHSEIFTRLQAQFGEECFSQARVYSWAKSFKEGRDHVENEPHAQRPRTYVTPANIIKIEELIQDNRRVTIHELSQETGISVGSVEEVVHSKLKFSKVSARWVP